MRTRRTATESRLTTGRLRKEEFFARAFRASPHPIGITELDSGRCIEINDACLDIYGYHRDEVIGKTTLMLGIWPDPRDRASFIERVKKEGSVRNLEVSMRVKGGALRQFIISTELITFNGKECLLTIGNDITERKRAEDALRESEQRFRAIYDQTYEFIGLLDPRGTVIDVNRTALLFRGLQLSDVVGKPFWETPWWDLSQDLRDRLRAGIVQAAQGEFVRINVQHRRLDGELEEIDFSLTPIIDRNGRVTQIIPEGRRITALTRAQAQLQQAHVELERRVQDRTMELERAHETLLEHEALMRAFLDNSTTVAWMKDAEGRHVYVSPTFERRFGMTPDDWRAKTDFELWPTEVAERFRANDLAVLKDDRVIEVEEEAWNPDGSSSWWLSHKFLYQDAAGTRYVGGLGVEITDRKRVEHELRQSQEELRQHRAQLEELAAKLLRAQESERRRIARELHDDISQRLAASVLDISSLEQRPPLLPELTVHALEPIRLRLEQLSDDVHNLAYGLHPSLLEHAGLQPTIEEHVHQVTKRTGLPIALKVRDVPASIPLDHAICLFRVLQESLQNVIKHACATEVTVKLSGSSKGIGLSVMDDGKGFDPQDKAAHQKGLGLSSMQERLRLLEGFLRIHSREGAGTKVCAWMPFKEAGA